MSGSELNSNSFYQYLLDNGYYFNKDIVENFLLSIKVKPFVIFTGNSGTGKTKLSQLFAKFIDKTSTVANQHIDDSQNFVTVKAKTNYASWNKKGWTLSKENFFDIFPIRGCESSNFEMLVDGKPANGRINIGIQLYYDSDELKDHLKDLYEKDDNAEVDVKIDCKSLKQFVSSDYIKPNGSILLKQNSNKSAFNERQWFISNTIFDYYPFNQGYTKCTIVVDEIESSARIRVIPRLFFSKNDDVQEYLRLNEGKEVTVELKINDFNFEDFEPKWNCLKIDDNKNNGGLDKPKNNDFYYKIVPVGANWTDNTNIVGYYNVITEEYQSTPAYELINNAKTDINNPYFLILDEMNLSHVERYFADFLSAIESKEAIPLYGDNNKTLTLPENLFIIGTVNVDETTYMFSPKVLDRANTIEFDNLTAWEYMFSDSEFEDFNGDINYLQSPILDADVNELNIMDLKEIFLNISCGDKNLWEILATELTGFQEILKDSGFDFGFRVINEILRFMLVSWRYENSPSDWQNWERYFDAQIKQKILPKLHGSEKAIGNVLNNLFNICLVERNNNENPKHFDIDKNNCRYFTSALKLKDMSKVLSDQRYVSFIN